MAEAAAKLVDEIDAAAETQTHVDSYRAGLLRRINGGYQNGTLNVIAARPSNGKSVLALQFAEGIGRGFEYSIYDGDNYFVTRQPPTPTLLVSLEMTEEELARDHSQPPPRSMVARSTAIESPPESGRNFMTPPNGCEKQIADCGNRIGLASRRLEPKHDCKPCHRSRLPCG